MTIRIYKISNPQWQPDPELPDYLPIPPQSAEIAVNGNDYAYLVGEGGFTDWDALGAIVGSWDDDTGLQTGQSYDTQEPPQVIGTPTFPVTADYTDWIRPLGNEDGRATGLLDSTRWQGDVEQKFLQDDNRYPSTDSPFTLEIIRQDYGSTAQPWDTNAVYNTGDFATSGGMWRSLQDNNQGNTPFGGSAFWEFINQSGFWGWVVKMISDDPLRDITARGIGVYTDPECTQYQYTTGAFINDGKYGDVFYSECPAGQRQANPDQVNFALLLGSAQEGYYNLPELGDESEALFWRDPQIFQVGVGSLDYIKITQYGNRYGGKISDDTLNTDELTPDGYQIEELTVGVNNRFRLRLVGGVRDDADPTVTIRRIVDGAPRTFSMIWSAGASGYLSGPETDAHASAVANVDYFRLIDIVWN